MGKPKKKDLPDLSSLALPGVEFAVRVTPKAARNTVEHTGGSLRVRVTVAPENGKANAAVQALLAAALGVAPSDLALVRGQSARDKLFRLTG